jgi:RHS repeat-associated protein
VVISNSQYDLDVLNRLTTEHNNGTNRNFEYDKIDQVKSVTGSSSEGYTYDKNGNRTNTGYVTGVGNRLLSDGVYNYQYDDEGNRKQRTNILTQVVDDYTWDYRNRLIAIVTTDAGGAAIKTVGYEYDVDDQRVGKQLTIDNGQLTTTTHENYYLDRNQIAFVTDGGGNETFHYLYGLNIDQVLAQDSPTGMVSALADRLGTVDTLTDGVGNVVDTRTYDSFGKLLNESDPTVSFRYGYTGREEDQESGLDYYRARYYDPNVGRFISVDPIGFDAGDTNPNLYRYVGNNSTNWTDPTGEYAVIDDLIRITVGAGIGYVAGGAISAIRQTAQMIDGRKRWGDYNVDEIQQNANAGAVAGVVLAYLPELALAATVLGAGFSIVSASNEFRHENWATGAVDLATAGLSFFRPPGGGTKSSPAYAGAAVATADIAAGAAGAAGIVGGAAIVGGRNFGNLLGHHVMSMMSGDPNNNGGSGKDSSRDPLSDSLPGEAPAEPVYNDKRKINHPGELTNSEMQAIVDLLQNRLIMGTKNDKYKNVTTLTVTPEGRAILTRNNKSLTKKQKDLATEIFGEGNVEFVQAGKKGTPNSTRGDSPGDAEARAIEYLGEVPQGTRQASSHYACGPCSDRQEFTNIENVTGMANPKYFRSLDHLQTPIPRSK